MIQVENLEKVRVRFQDYRGAQTIAVEGISWAINNPSEDYILLINNQWRVQPCGSFSPPVSAVPAYYKQNLQIRFLNKDTLEKVNDETIRFQVAESIFINKAMIC